MKDAFIQGMKDGIPIGLGYFSVSVAFGMSAAVLGITIGQAVLISLTNLTSAGQFAGTDLIAAHAGLVELILTMIIINARYFLMSLSLSQKVDPKMGFWQRLLVSYGITDEIFAVEIGKKGRLSFSYIMGLILVSAFGWVFGTFVGAAAGNLLPADVTAALNIALYAMFIAIVVPPSLSSSSVAFCTVGSAALSCLFSILPGFRNISSGYTIIIVTLTVSLVCALKYPVQPADESDETVIAEGEAKRRNSHE